MVGRCVHCLLFAVLVVDHFLNESPHLAIVSSIANSEETTNRFHSPPFFKRMNAQFAALLPVLLVLSSQPIMASDFTEVPVNASAASHPEVRIVWDGVNWETSGNTEVSHEEEVYCAADGEGTPNAV